MAQDAPALSSETSVTMLKTSESNITTKICKKVTSNQFHTLTVNTATLKILRLKIFKKLCGVLFCDIINIFTMNSC